MPTSRPTHGYRGTVAAAIALTALVAAARVWAPVTPRPALTRLADALPA